MEYHMYNNLKKILFFLIAISLFFTTKAAAKTYYSSSESGSEFVVPDSGFVVGKYLYTFEFEPFNMQGIDLAYSMIASKTITSTDIKDYIVYYKIMDDLWFDMGTGNPVEAPETFEIEYVDMMHVRDAYTITFNSNGGSQVPSQDVVFGERITEPTPPTKTGYTFTGWFYLGTENRFDFNTTVEGELTLEAHWSNGTYDIVYNLNGGTANISNTTCGFGEDNCVLSTTIPTRDGYTFLGWGIGNDATKAVYGPGAKANSITSSTTYNLIAVWKSNEYSISYDLAGGILANTNPTSYNKETNTFTLNNPTRTGYIFEGWTGSNGNTKQTSVSVEKGSEGNKNYTANWKEITYTINYSDGTTSTSCKYDESCPISAPKQRAGETFKNWYTTIDGNTVYYEANSVVKNLTTTNNATINLTATFDNNNYYITYDLNGGSLGSGVTLITEFNKASSRITLPNNLVREGYTFTGWTGSNGNTPNTNVTMNPSDSSNYNNQAYKANWSANTYTIEYKESQNDPNPRTQTCTYDQNCTLSILGNLNAGYQSYGWEYNGTLYNNGSIVKNLAQSGTITMLHVITPNTYTITYNVNGGTVTGNPTTFTFGDQTVIRLNNPTKKGYTFDGWSGTGITGASTDVVVNTTTPNNKYYEATWTPIAYNINLGNISGATEDIQGATTYTVEDENVFLGTYKKDGYKFKGWSTVENGDTGIYIQPRPTDLEDKTYYAVWETIDYSISYDLDGGTANGLVTNYNVESDTITLPSVTKEHYEFVGWSGTDTNGTQENVTINTGSVGDRRYRAMFEPIEYRIVYDYNGGTSGIIISEDNPDPVVNTYTALDDGITIFLPELTKPGYKFLGWDAIIHEQPYFNKYKYFTLSEDDGNIWFQAQFEAIITTTSGDGTNLGDEVTIGDKDFYVISSTNGETTLITKDNISENTPFYTGYNSYWRSMNGQRPSATYGNAYPANVFDTNSSLYNIVDIFKSDLEANGVEVLSATIPSIELLTTTLSCTDTDCSGAESWVYSSNYWTSTATSNSNLYVVRDTNAVQSLAFNNSNTAGVRVVITIPSNLIG